IYRLGHRGLAGPGHSNSRSLPDGPLVEPEAWNPRQSMSRSSVLAENGTSVCEAGSSLTSLLSLTTWPRGRSLLTSMPFYRDLVANALTGDLSPNWAKDRKR